MILIGMGSNLTTETFKTSQEVLEAALNMLANKDISVEKVSSWYLSAPVPISDQPWFVNGSACLRTSLPPAGLLARLHDVEACFGRVRTVRNASRTLDLDLLAYGDEVTEVPGGLLLPHPRIAERAFVLLPLAELAPDWHHPVNGLTAAEMLAALPPGQQVERIDG